MTNHAIPAGYGVRYDYHTQPVAITAVVMAADGHIAAVGVAKFSAKDPHFSYETGEQIALGRALRHMKDGHGLGGVRIDLGELTPLADDKLPGYISGDLEGTPVVDDVLRANARGRRARRRNEIALQRQRREDAVLEARVRGHAPRLDAEPVIDFGSYGRADGRHD